MIERIQLQHFQAHTKLSINFDQVTTLIGSTDVGKTAVLRALRWLCCNRPAGDAFLQDGADSVIVRLWVDGQTVGRRRGKSNEYRLGDEVYKAFGSEVPPAIAELLNVQDVNFQQQHDAPFWFALTAGQVSKQLNAIVNLDQLDRVLGKVSQRLRHSQTVVEVAHARHLAALETADRLKWVKEAHQQLKALENEAEALQGLKRRIERMGLSLEQGKTALERRDRARMRLSEALRGFQQVSQHFKEWATLEKSTQELVGRLKKVQAQRSHACQLQKEARQVQKEIKALTKGRCPICLQPFPTP